MASWRLNPALTRFRSEVDARYPKRDKKSDGTIGDAAHQATNSDHNPDKDGSVDAWDMDSGPNVDVQACINAALKHESIQYIIYNRRITSRTWGLGTWRPYTGASPHTEHVHFNTRPSHENSTKPWFPEEDKVAHDPLDEKDVGAVANAVAKVLNVRYGFPVDADPTAFERLTKPTTVTLTDAQLNALADKVITALQSGEFVFRKDEA